MFQGPFHLSLEHFIEHYSRFADGIPTRLRLAVSTSGRVINIEHLMPSSANQNGRELVKMPSASSVSPGGPSGDAWALGPASTGPHGGRMGAPLVMQGHGAFSGRLNAQSAVSLLELSFTPADVFKMTCDITR